MEKEGFIYRLFTSEEKRLMDRAYAGINDAIIKFKDYTMHSLKYPKIVDNDYFRVQYQQYITSFKIEADSLYNEMNHPFAKKMDILKKMTACLMIIDNNIAKIKRDIKDAENEVEDAIKEMKQFIENGCNGFFKLIPIRYSTPIYCYCPNIKIENDIDDIPYITGNVYSVISSDKLQIGKIVKITPIDYHISNNFSYKELNEIYIPRRIEMEKITNEKKAVEFINKIKELYNISKKK